MNSPPGGTILKLLCDCAVAENIKRFAIRRETHMLDQLFFSSVS